VREKGGDLLIHLFLGGREKKKKRGDVIIHHLCGRGKRGGNGRQMLTGSSHKE